MNITIEREKLINKINMVEDVHLIKAIKEMLTYAQTAKEEKALKPFTDKELVSRIRKSEADIKNGRLTSVKELRKEVKNW